METPMTANITASSTQAAALTDTAIIILSAAARRNDRLLFPLPKSITSTPKVIKKTIESLIAKSLVEERPAGMQDIVWRENEQEQKFSLSITDQGIAALEGPQAEEKPLVEAKESAEEKPKLASLVAKRGSKSKKPPISKKTSKGMAPHKVKARKASKSDQVLTLLSRGNGATLAEIMTATGWQAHSVRGFLSGTVKKRIGLELLSEREEGKDRRYRVKS
jgi:hypothetical protein